MSRSISRLSPQSVSLDAMLTSWERHLKSARKSDFTIRSYADSVRILIRHLGDRATTDVTADDLRGFFAAELGRVSPSSVGVYFRSLRVFFGWLAAEEPAMMPVSPMTGLQMPRAPRKHKPPFDSGEITAFLKATSGNGFEDRRDHAIIRVLIDTGMRVSGLAGLRLVNPDAEPDRTDVLLGRQILIIRLKGGDQLPVPIGRKATAAIDRYLRARLRHRYREEQWLWLGPRGQFTSWGIRQMLERRGRRLGIDGVYPHRFRHTFADKWMEGGGDVYDLMKITGWKSLDMVKVYADARAVERARSAHARLSPGDRL